MDEQIKVFLATIYGEAASCSPASWRAIASVILNRVAAGEWRKHRTPLAVIAHTGFDAFAHQNAPFLTALRLLEHPDDIGEASPLGKLMEAVLPLYGGREARTTDAVLYYSPKAQAGLHKRNPRKWPAAPAWRFELLEAVDVPGTEVDDFAWFRYRRAAV